MARGEDPNSGYFSAEVVKHNNIKVKYVTLRYLYSSPKPADQSFFEESRSVSFVDGDGQGISLSIDLADRDRSDFLKFTDERISFCGVVRIKDRSLMEILGMGKCSSLFEERKKEEEEKQRLQQLEREQAAERLRRYWEQRNKPLRNMR